ncbi:hypothetical protein [Rubripirellula reticaptiva]|uniref:Uncharacterized protein n=1 Tax=Rubripirellula reticaptiva TaxID=2528013 RepID=A0A5C6ESN2_9BACT|nr:hypothetical protein [Rubripirellula reticaptiva]TWU52008.1 hypothetical protein Poly59_36050 [Rubripirellula reticaptiva]
MLDLDHPDTPPTFAISREGDAILSIAKRMTLVSTEAKQALLSRSIAHFAKMRSITIEHWGESKPKLDAIDLLQHDLQRLALQNSTNDFVNDWRGKLCTVCGASITNLEKYSDMLYCPKCLDVIDGGRDAVDQAFGLICI